MIHVREEFGRFAALSLSNLLRIYLLFFYRFETYAKKRRDDRIRDIISNYKVVDGCDVEKALNERATS